jgi:Flp pilus assembly protein TadB
MLSSILGLLAFLGMVGGLMLWARKEGKQSAELKQAKVDNANLNEQAQDWSDRPRDYDAFSKRLRDAAKRKGGS